MSIEMPCNCQTAAEALDLSTLGVDQLNLLDVTIENLIADLGRDSRDGGELLDLVLHNSLGALQVAVGDALTPLARP